MLYRLATLLALLGLALAESRTSAPSGAIVVATDGSGDYTTVQDAVDSLSTSSSDDQSIFIDQGTYNEQVYVPARSAQLTIYGYTTDTSSYAGNGATITQDLSQDDVSSNDLTATLRAWSEGLKVYNVNLVNTRGSGSQALAVSAEATKQGYYGCQFLGFQDTVLSQTGNQVFAQSYIEGATDFIFGQDASTWFSGVDIGVLPTSAGIGYITANGRDSDDNDSYYVIDHSTIAAANGESVDSGIYYLGRPWGDYARVVFQYTAMSDVINSAGWHIWNTGDERTDNVLFGEYDNTGDGASGDRADFATTLSSAVSITTILGSDYEDWVDTSYLAA